jgi:aromatic amino acid aminotransferase I
MLPLAPYTPPAKSESLQPDLSEELQYSSTYGTKHLLSFIHEHVERVHSPKYGDWVNLLTAGNTDGVDGVMRACFDGGDYMLVEEFGESGRKEGVHQYPW